MLTKTANTIINGIRVYLPEFPPAAWNRRNHYKLLEIKVSKVLKVNALKYFGLEAKTNSLCYLLLPAISNYPILICHLRQHLATEAAESFLKNKSKTNIVPDPVKAKSVSGGLSPNYSKLQKLKQAMYSLYFDFKGRK